MSRHAATTLRALKARVEAATFLRAKKARIKKTSLFGEAALISFP
jgi:hypothetical protein